MLGDMFAVNIARIIDRDFCIFQQHGGLKPRGRKAVKRVEGPEDPFSSLVSQTIKSDISLLLMQAKYSQRKALEEPFTNSL
ncbi:hypothetical protein IWW34DRAFT_639381 [Fusarium oxysporum f. sp. albedinis]